MTNHYPSISFGREIASRIQAPLSHRLTPFRRPTFFKAMKRVLVSVSKVVPYLGIHTRL